MEGLLELGRLSPQRIWLHPPGKKTGSGGDSVEQTVDTTRRRDIVDGVNHQGAHTMSGQKVRALASLVAAVHCLGYAVKLRAETKVNVADSECQTQFCTAVAFSSMPVDRNGNPLGAGFPCTVNFGQPAKKMCIDVTDKTCAYTPQSADRCQGTWQPLGQMQTDVCYYSFLDCK